MSEEKTYSESETQRLFAVRFHGKVWELLEKPDRTKQEDELMIHTAHASCCHWLSAGTGVYRQRGEWLIAEKSFLPSSTAATGTGCADRSIGRNKI